MKKTIYVVNIDDYMPDVFSITRPTIEKYASKINADLQIISERKLTKNGGAVTYEKTQVYELGKDNDWNILIDADMAISLRLPDVTNIVPPTHVGVHMSYVASKHFPCDMYFFRDDRDIAIAADFMVASKACHDIWTPLEDEPSSYNLKRPFMLDEYCFAKNLARYGLKFAGAIPDEGLIFHLNEASEGGKTIAQLERYVAINC